LGRGREHVLHSVISLSAISSAVTSKVDMALAVAIHEVSSTGSPVAAERRAAAGRRAVLLLLPELLRCLLLRSEVLCSELLLLLALLLPGHHGKRMIIC
jgi:hypothetical protein